MIAFALPPLTLEILDGDIAAESTDAVVNAANNDFWMGSGVAGALKARGGLQLEADAMAQGPVEPGEGVMTSGGRLPAPIRHSRGCDGQICARPRPSSIARRALAEARRDPSARVGRIPRVRNGGRRLPARRVRAGHDRRDRSVRPDGQIAARRPARPVRQTAYRTFAEVAGELLGAPLDGPPTVRSLDNRNATTKTRSSTNITKKTTGFLRVLRVLRVFVVPARI